MYICRAAKGFTVSKVEKDLYLKPCEMKFLIHTGKPVNSHSSMRPERTQSKAMVKHVCAAQLTSLVSQ